MVSAPNRCSSIWLLAAKADEADLQAIINDLSERHGAPQFHPHLTLAGDLPRTPADMQALAGDIARATVPFGASVLDVVAGNAYFQSFYALFQTGPNLVALRTAAAELLKIADTSFIPHISLLYGAVPEAAKYASVEKIGKALIGRSIRFDRIAVTNSANDVPISQWRQVRTFPLGEPEW